MKTETKQSLLASNARLSDENTTLFLALHDLVAGDVKWFGRAPFRLGVSRPNGAAGGIVTVVANGTTSADYFERFARNQLEHIAACVTGHDSEHNRELLARRRTIEDAQAYVTTAQRAVAA